MKITTLEHLNKFIAQTGKYFRYAEVKDFLSLQNTKVSNSTLKTYLSRKMADKEIFSAGKGWYSKIRDEFELNIEPLSEVISILKTSFPLLDFSCWSTEQLNSYTHHVLSKHLIFIYLDSDSFPSVLSILKDKGFSVYANPNKKEIEKYFTVSERTVILRQGITKQPKAIDGASPIEKMLVDMILENNKLSFMSEADINSILNSVALSGRISIATMESYAKRRDLDVAPLLKINQVQNN